MAFSPTPQLPEDWLDGDFDSPARGSGSVENSTESAVKNEAMMITDETTETQGNNITRDATEQSMCFAGAVSDCRSMEVEAELENKPEVGRDDFRSIATTEAPVLGARISEEGSQKSKMGWIERDQKDTEHEPNSERLPEKSGEQTELSVDSCRDFELIPTTENAESGIGSKVETLACDSLQNDEVLITEKNLETTGVTMDTPVSDIVSEQNFSENSKPVFTSSDESLSNNSMPTLTPNSSMNICLENSDSTISTESEGCPPPPKITLIDNQPFISIAIVNNTGRNVSISDFRQKTEPVLDDSEPKIDADSELTVKRNSRFSSSSTDENCAVDGSGFCWDEFFERTGALPQASEIFKHVELSLKTGAERYIKPGDWLDVPSLSKTEKSCYYWPAQVVLVCSRMLRLRWRTELNARRGTEDSKFRRMDSCSKSSKNLTAGISKTEDEEKKLVKASKSVEIEESDNINEFWWDLNSALGGRKIFPIRHSAPIPELCEENHHYYRPPPELQLEDGLKIRNLFSPLNKEDAVNEKFYRADDLVYERFKVNDVLEVQGRSNPTNVYFAKVCANVGGRLKLELCDEPMEENVKEKEKEVLGEFWEWYTSERLHYVGWSESEGAFKFGTKYASYSEIVVEKYIGSPQFRSPPRQLKAVDKEAFEDSTGVEPHKFEVGMRLEMLDLLTRAEFFPGTVTRIVNDYYFEVKQDVYHRTKTAFVEDGGDEKMDTNTATESEHCQIDKTGPETAKSTNSSQDQSLSIDSFSQNANTTASNCVTENLNEPLSIEEEKIEPQTRICHKGSEGIFPAWWCQRVGLRLFPPPGYPDGEDFSWGSYIRLTGGKFASEDLFSIPNLESYNFKRGRKLEIVDPDNPSKLCAASVARINRHLLWIHLDDRQETGYSRGYDCRSTDLFPYGWAESNGRQVAAPVDRNSKEWDRQVENIKNAKLNSEKKADFYQTRTEHYMPKHWLPASGSAWTGRFFVNANCFAGPYLCPVKLRWMPREFGPGPVRLVLKTLLNHLMSCAYRPRDALELVQPEFGSANAGREILAVKARFKSRRFTGSVEVCKFPEQFGEWIRQILTQLDACPYLVNWEKVEPGRSCPGNCHKMAKMEFLAPNKSTAGSKRSGKKITRRLRRPSILAGLHSGLGLTLPAHVETNKERALRKRPARPVAVVEAARRPVTRGVKLPKFGANGVQQKKEEKKEEGKKGQRGMNKNGNKPDLKNESKPPAAKEAKVKPMGISKPLPIVQNDSSLAREKLMSGGYPIPTVKSNPNGWSVEELCTWLENTDAASAVTRLQDEEVDGQAFLLLTIEDCQKYLQLKFGPALKLCGIIRELKVICLRDYCKSSSHTNSTV